MNSTSLLALTALAIGQVDAPASFYQDLRNGLPIQPGLMMTGPYLGKYTFRDKEGLRVLLPPRREKPGPIGLQTDFVIAGDFEITGSYEILASDQPTKANTMAGVNIWIRQGQDDKRFARIGRFYSRNHGQVYEMQHTDRNRPKATTITRVPAEIRAGQLRLTRKGTTLICSAKDETTDGAFKELFVAPDFGADEISITRFVVNTGDEFYAIEARLIDLRIQGSGGVPDRAGALGDADAAPNSTRWSLIAIVVAGFVLLAFGGALGLTIMLRKRQAATKGL